jgi:hypothetical protein
MSECGDVEVVSEEAVVFEQLVNLCGCECKSLLRNNTGIGIRWRV